MKKLLLIIIIITTLGCSNRNHPVSKTIVVNPVTNEIIVIKRQYSKINIDKQRQR